MARRIVDLSFPIDGADPRGTVRLEPYKTFAEHRARITLVFSMYSSATVGLARMARDFWVVVVLEPSR